VIRNRTAYSHQEFLNEKATPITSLTPLTRFPSVLFFAYLGLRPMIALDATIPLKRARMTVAHGL
jgi:hypothetical protein